MDSSLVPISSTRDSWCALGDGSDSSTSTDDEDASACDGATVAQWASLVVLPSPHDEATRPRGEITALIERLVDCASRAPRATNTSCADGRLLAHLTDGDTCAHHGRVSGADAIEKRAIRTWRRHIAPHVDGTKGAGEASVFRHYAHWWPRATALRAIDAGNDVSFAERLWGVACSDTTVQRATRALLVAAVWRLRVVAERHEAQRNHARLWDDACAALAYFASRLADGARKGPTCRSVTLAICAAWRSAHQGEDRPPVGSCRLTAFDARQRPVVMVIELAACALRAALRSIREQSANEALRRCVFGVWLRVCARHTETLRIVGAASASGDPQRSHSILLCAWLSRLRTVVPLWPQLDADARRTWEELFYHHAPLARRLAMVLEYALAQAHLDADQRHRYFGVDVRTSLDLLVDRLRRLSHVRSFGVSVTQ